MTQRSTDADAAVELPFGRYRGWLIMDVPEDYLRWLLTNHVCRSTALRQAVYAEWSERERGRRARLERIKARAREVRGLRASNPI